jgi:hypothetical protein
MNAESTRNLDEILSTEQLEGFQSRAAGYDANNEFFQEDFDEMKTSGYLIQAVPEELGVGQYAIAFEEWNLISNT